MKRCTYYIGFLIRMWWCRLTIFYSGLKGRPIPSVSSIEEIPERLHWGQEWKKDPRKADKWYHPRYTQRRIEDKHPGLGDCDDHALYWCLLLLRHKLVKRAWVGVIMYDSVGHAVAVFEGFNGRLFWADYGLPRETTRATWWSDVALAYGSKRLWLSFMVEISVRRRDTPGLTLRWRDFFVY